MQIRKKQHPSSVLIGIIDSPSRRGQSKELLFFICAFQLSFLWQVSNRALRLGANRRAEILEDMENSAPMVVDLLKACIGMFIIYLLFVVPISATLRLINTATWQCECGSGANRW